jgi:uncharacterized protein (DUF885 family)
MRIMPVVAVLLVACSPSPSVAGGSGSSGGEMSDAVAGVQDPALAALLRDHWEDALETDPLLGTMIGDHRRDDAMPDVSHEAELQRRRTRAGFLERARAVSPESIEAADRITHAIFLEMLEAESGSEVCESHLWNASAMDNPVSALSRIAPLSQLVDVAAGRAYIARLHAYARFTDQLTANLAIGAEQGRFAPRASLERLAAMVRAALEAPLETWVPVAHAAQSAASWSEADRASLLAEVRAALDGDVRAAFARYLAAVEALAPRARDGAHEGVLSLPDGAACYAAEIRRHTGSQRAADELHALGGREIAGTDARLLALGGPRFGVGSATEVLDRLRTDPSLGYATGEEILADATARIREAEARAPAYFARRAETPCEVRPIPSAEAPTAGFAFYMPGTPDGSREGAYYVNTAEPASRRRHLLAAVTAHEAVPGHHFQLTVALGLTALPAFRRHAHFTAYVEGWGLYAERLADEMGLYHDDIDRLGAVDLEAFRAARLVVDTGLHALGWSRAQAESYLREHTAMSPDLVVAEVDRYINWPGQALAYKVGQLALLGLRAEAEQALGERFDARSFHDVVLGLGPVSLNVLEAEVRRWVREQRG